MGEKKDRKVADPKFAGGIRRCGAQQPTSRGTAVQKNILPARRPKTLGE